MILHARLRALLWALNRARSVAFAIARSKERLFADHPQGRSRTSWCEITADSQGEFYLN
jgi:hypothetical protein